MHTHFYKHILYITYYTHILLYTQLYTNAYIKITIAYMHTHFYILHVTHIYCYTHNYIHMHTYIHSKY